MVGGRALVVRVISPYPTHFPLPLHPSSPIFLFMEGDIRPLRSASNPSTQRGFRGRSAAPYTEGVRGDACPPGRLSPRTEGVRGDVCPPD
jgi:hypothetical protein